jgi:hypothetical protein
MARARNVKPSLFKNEVLGVADPLLSLLFVSLWCLADKAGRLEDRPLRIKAETFPYRDGANVEEMLNDLHKYGFIRRYVVGELRLIQIVNFDKHQHPHRTEKESELPQFQEVTGITVKAPLSNGYKTPDSLQTLTLQTEEDAATAAPKADPVETRIWTDGVDLLKRSGLSEPQSRPLLGRWAREHGKEALAEAIAKCQATNPADPRSYMGGILRARQADKAKSQTGKYIPPTGCERCNGTLLIDGVPCQACDRVNYEAYMELREMEAAAA